MPIPVTLLYGALNVLLTTALGLNVSLGRVSEKTGLGQAPSDGLLRRVRAHGNNAEWVPLGLLMLLLLELSGAGPLQLNLYGGLLLLTRVGHAGSTLGRLPISKPNAVLNYALFVAMGIHGLLLRFATH